MATNTKTSIAEEPVIAPGHTNTSISEKISGIVLTAHTPLWWFGALAVALGFVALLTVSAGWLFMKGPGIWGINIPVGWGFAIINFVWWVGIAHAGTLISAILLLLNQNWRTSINRFAEAMTLFAVMCAGMFPIFHLGRPWLFYWLLPYPNSNALWPQFRSPLMWDVFAVSTYATVSALFWFVGLVPDLAIMRDRAKNKVAKLLFAIGAMGWRGSAKHWNHYETAYKLLAGLACPLVLSVHTIVGFDFAVSLIPGWHATIFPPYFVAGAVFSGFAMVLTFMIPLRKLLKLEDMITMVHLENMAKVMLAMGMIVTYGYCMEMFTGWYSANTPEQFVVWNRLTGPYAPFFIALLFCNGVAPQILWFKKARTCIPLLFVLSIVVNIGMWLERFIIVVTSLHRDFLPSSWDMYTPTFWDWSIFFGTIGFFCMMVLLFVRFLPMISMFEMKTLIPQSSKASKH